MKAGLNKSDLHDVLAQNENILTEKQMLEDKINFTDWEATNEVIEEQVYVVVVVANVLIIAMLLFMGN